MKKLILASASPRRKDLMTQIGLQFTVLAAQGEEKSAKENPADVVEELSQAKAEEVYERLLRQELPGSPGISGKDAVIIGADTVVSIGGVILGKPKDEGDALRMLSMLSGNTHQVYTGVTLLWQQDGRKQKAVFAECTLVTMYPADTEQLLSYIATGEPMDKAGAYGIQGKGAMLVKEITGDYNNVVGLPVSRLYQELRERKLL